MPSDVTDDSLSHNYQFLVIIHKRIIIEPVLDDGLDELLNGGIPGGNYPDRGLRGLPQPQVAEDTFDHVAFVDQSYNSHLPPAVRAEERIRFPDLPDQLPPFL